MQKYFARLSSMIALSCLIKNQQTFLTQAGSAMYSQLYATHTSDSLGSSYKYSHGPKYLRKPRNRQCQLYILAGTFFVSLISHIVACQQALLQLLQQALLQNARASGEAARPLARAFSQGSLCLPNQESLLAGQSHWLGTGYTNILLPESADSGVHPFFMVSISI